MHPSFLSDTSAVIPGTGINCAFCMADPTMNAQQPMPAMPIQHDRQHEGFCSFSPLRPCAFLVLDLTRSRKGAETRRVALNSGYRSNWYLCKKAQFVAVRSSHCNAMVHKDPISPTTHGASSSHFQSGMNTIFLPSISSSLSVSSVMIRPSTSPNSSIASTSALTSRFSISSFIE